MRCIKGDLFLETTLMYGQYCDQNNFNYLGKGLHGERPLSYQFIPASKRGKDRKEVIPQFSADVHI